MVPQPQNLLQFTEQNNRRSSKQTWHLLLPQQNLQLPSRKMQIGRPLSVVQTSENPGPDGRASKQRNLGTETETRGLGKRASVSSAASMRAASECVRVWRALSLSPRTDQGLKGAPASSGCGWAGSHPLARPGPGARPGGRWKPPVMLHGLFSPDPQPNQPTNPNQPPRPRETAESLLPQKSLYRHAFTVY